MNVKKAVSLLLALALLFVLSACGADTVKRAEDTEGASSGTFAWTREGYFTDEDGNLIKVVMKDSFPYEKSEDLHLYPTKFTTELDGVQYRLFYKLKNSSALNTVEFSKLLDGLKSELDEINNAN